MKLTGFLELGRLEFVLIPECAELVPSISLKLNLCMLDGSDAVFRGVASIFCEVSVKLAFILLGIASWRESRLYCP